MIDLHCHMLPSVDDGANSISLALEMAKQAKDNGINKVLLTPHHMDGDFINHKKDIEKSVSNFQKILYDNNIDIEVRAGQEVHINGLLLRALDDDDILFADGNRKKYLMLELPHSGVPEYTNNMIFELKVRGITPIIVHPERNYEIQQNPNILYDLVSQGCLTQLTATSYVGGFGKSIQKFTDEIVDSGLGFMFSSDAHNLDGRRFLMKSAFDRLEKKSGKSKVDEFILNSNLVWNGRDIFIGDIKKISRKRKILRKVNCFFLKKRR